MSDLSKYLPKKYQKESSSDQNSNPAGSFTNQSKVNGPMFQSQQIDGTQLNNDKTEKFPKKIKNEKTPEQKKTVLLGVLLLLLLVGTLTSLFLIKRSQDIRQQASPYCIEQCPGSDGILRNCTPPDSDGTPQESICNRAGRIESCGGRQYCCPRAGGTWTTTMTACDSTPPVEPTTPPTTPSVPPSVPPTAKPTNPPTVTPSVPPTIEPTTPPLTPSIEPTDLPKFACSISGCATDDQCEDGLICIQGSPDQGVGVTVGICGLASLTDECRNNRNYNSCCVAPTTTTTPSPTANLTDTPTQSPTDTLTDAPTGEPTPVLTRVITTVGCNESCNENADCSNVSHICYEGACRLDVNPTDVNCRLVDGGTVIERAAEVPTESGFADWFNYLKAGLGVLGLGALLLLLL